MSQEKDTNKLPSPPRNKKFKPGLKMRCGTCREIGHMRTNKACPLYPNWPPGSAIVVLNRDPKTENIKKTREKKFEEFGEVAGNSADFWVSLGGQDGDQEDSVSDSDSADQEMEKVPEETEEEGAEVPIPYDANYEPKQMAAEVLVGPLGEAPDSSHSRRLS